ncbi:MAG: DNA primase [Anaerolineae bacterium]|nr:DNA primase [Anaerolineae bacterium]
MSQIDDIKSKLDIVSYIQQYASLKRAGRTYKACCPFHSEKTPSFVVNPDKQTWRCFGACNEGGDIFSFAQKYHHWNFGEALEELGRLAGVDVRPQSPLDRQKEERKDRLRGLMTAASEYYHAQLQLPTVADVLRYAKEKRGFTDETITRYQIGYAPQGWQNLHDEFTKLGYSEEELLEVGLLSKNEAGRVYDRFRNRLMIPIRDEKGRVIAFGARALHPDDQPKYLNSPQTILFDKSHTLFGLDVAKTIISKHEVAVIVEGYMDVIQAHQAGFLNVVAQMGTALTEHQVKLIAPRYAKKIILALDSDTAGQSATRKSIDTVREVLQSDYGARLSVDIRVLQIPDAKDPDDLIRENPNSWEKLVAEATAAVQFVIMTETADLPKGIEMRQVPLWEREAVAKRILPILSASQNSVTRRENLQQLATRLYLDYVQLLQWSEGMQTTPKETPPKKTLRVLPPPPTKSDMPDEPPPLDLASIAPPPDDDGFSPVPVPPNESKGKSEWDWQPVVVHRPPKLTAERALEAYCLKMLFKAPTVYYQISRKLRSLANQDEILLQDNLSELSPRDFFANDYQVLMRLFIEAIEQQDQETLDYVQANSTQSLKQVLDQLFNLDVTTEIKRQLNHKFVADIQAIVQNTVIELTDEQVVRESMLTALKLRRSRLLQELQEYKIMLSDLDSREDEHLLQEIRIRVKYVAKAMGALDKGIQEVQKM